ncbi:hypothetical protein HD806DRAFT_481846, partial [Xylariaceae sp. AK1471]
MFKMQVSLSALQIMQHRCTLISRHTFVGAPHKISREFTWKRYARGVPIDTTARKGFLSCQVFERPHMDSAYCRSYRKNTSVQYNDKDYIRMDYGLFLHFFKPTYYRVSPLGERPWHYLYVRSIIAILPIALEEVEKHRTQDCSMVFFSPFCPRAFNGLGSPKKATSHQIIKRLSRECYFFALFNF